MNYIGIIGHRGSGKHTLAWFIAYMLEYEKMNKEDKKLLFDQMCAKVLESPSYIKSSYHVTIDSFGRFILDHIKMVIPGLEPYDLSNPETLEDYVIFPSTLEIRPLSESRGYQHVKLDLEPCQLFPFTDGQYLFIGEFIVYFADTIMKTTFGDKVWLNMMGAWAERRENLNIAADKYAIFYDVKTDAEYDWIRDHDGIIIDVKCPSRKRPGGYNKIKDKTGTLSITLHKNFEDDFDTIYNLSNHIKEYFNEI